MFIVTLNFFFFLFIVTTIVVVLYISVFFYYSYGTPKILKTAPCARNILIDDVFMHFRMQKGERKSIETMNEEDHMIDCVHLNTQIEMTKPNKPKILKLKKPKKKTRKQKLNELKPEPRQT